MGGPRPAHGRFRELQAALARIVQETRCTALLVTHAVDEALYLADRIVVLEGAPAKKTLEVLVAPPLRRSRYADLTDERGKLLAALGVDGRDERRHTELRILR